MSKSSQFNFGSYNRFKGETVNIPPVRVKTITRKAGKDTISYPSNWIEFRKYSSDLFSFYRKGYRDQLATTKLLLDEERGEFIRFYDCLQLWELVPKVEQQFDAEFYWINSISRGPEFTEWVKDYFQYSYRVAYGINFDQPDVKPLMGYNDVFPYQGLLKFHENIQDYEYSMFATGIPLEDDLDSLREVFEEMFREVGDFELISKLEILNESSTSSCYDDKNDRTIPNCLFNDNSFAKEMVGRRCVVPVFPGGVRDTVILTKRSSNTIRLLERQMRHILEKIPESAVTFYPETFHRRLRKVQNIKVPAVHFLRDIKKCGLTFPMDNFLDTFIEVGNRVYNTEFFNEFNIYKERKVRGFNPKDPTEYVYPLRGYFLGMANHLATFFLIACHRLALKDFEEEFPDVNLGVRSIFGNDDCDIAIWDKDDPFDSRHNYELCQTYAEHHKRVFNMFSVWYNSKKSFFSYSSLFFEEYSIADFKKKQSRYALVLANALSLPSIRLAKNHVKSFLASDDEILVEDFIPLLNYVVDKFGYEFYPDEANFDYYWGGWVPHTENSLSQCLMSIPDKDPRFLSRIFWHINNVVRLKNPPTTKVNNESDNLRTIGIALGLTGECDPLIFGLSAQKERALSFYKRLIIYERNVEGFNNLVEGSWKKALQKEFDFSLDQLAKLVIEKIDCSIPDWLIQEYTSSVELVNPEWIGNPELSSPNMSLKKLIFDLYHGKLKSSVYTPELPFDSWGYASIRSIKQTTSFAEFDFIPIAKGNIRNICSDGIISLVDYSVRTGKFIKRLNFKLEERNLPPWRRKSKANILGKGFRPYEEWDYSEEYEFPQIFGIEHLHLIPEEEEEEEPEDDPLEEIEEEIPQEEEEFYPYRRMELSDWNNLMIYSGLLEILEDTRCDIHYENPHANYYLPQPDCLPCRMEILNPHSELNQYTYDDEIHREYVSLEALKTHLFGDPPEEVDPLGDDDEGGFSMFD